jgi:hypothetical protein
MFENNKQSFASMTTSFNGKLTEMNNDHMTHFINLDKFVKTTDDKFIHLHNLANTRQLEIYEVLNKDQIYREHFQLLGTNIHNQDKCSDLTIPSPPTQHHQQSHSQGCELPPKPHAGGR